MDGTLALPGARAAGGSFDRDSQGGAFVRGFAPLAVETVDATPLPCPLSTDRFPDALAATGTATVIIAGFMTDVCVATGQETLQPFRDLEAIRAFMSSPGPAALFNMP